MILNYFSSPSAQVLDENEIFGFADFSSLIHFQNTKIYANQVI
jgi:hypothetical protein